MVTNNALATPPAEHVVMDLKIGGPRCLRCGQHAWLDLPMPVDACLRAMDDFVRAHAACQAVETAGAP